MDTTVRSPTEEQSARPEGLNFTQVAKEYNFDNYEEAMIRWGYPVFDIGVTDEHTLWTKYYKVDINRTFLVRLMQKFGESDHELRYDWDFIECLRTIFLGMRHAVLVYKHDNERRLHASLTVKTTHSIALSAEIYAMLPIDLLYLIKVNGKAVRLPDDTPVVINNPGYLYMNNLHQGCIVTIEKYQGVEYAIDISGKVIPSADTLALEIAMLTKRIDEIDSLKEKIAASYLDSGIRKSPHEETMEAVREAQALSDDSTIPGHKTMDALIKSLNK